MKKVFLIFVLYGCFVFPIIAQQSEEENDADSLQFFVAESNPQVKFKSFDLGKLNGFQHYRTFGTNHLPYARSGNLGLAAHSLSLEEIDWSVHHLLGAYQLYTLTGDDMKYYKVSRPLTELAYVNGSKSEQFFRVFHTQNLGEGLNVSFKYERMTSEGYYLRQLTNHTRFHFNYNLHSRNKRFHSRAFYVINNFKAQENAGIFLSENNKTEDNTILLDINLYDAQNRARSQEAGIKNQYALIQKDSSTSLLDLEHDFTYKRSFRNYQHDLTNSNEAFYRNAYFDTTYSKDSAYADNISNYLGLSFFQSRLTFGAQYDLFHYFQNNLIEKRLTSLYAKAVFQDTLLKQAVNVSFEKGLSGYHQDELDFEGKIAFQKMGSLQLNLNLGFHQKQPDYFLENYRSNQYFFDNNLKTINTKKLELELNEAWSGIKLDFSVKQLENYLYFDAAAAVRQYDELMNVLALRLKKKFSLFDEKLNLYNLIAYQQFSNATIIPLPELFSYHSLYFKNSFFNNHLHLEAGIDFYYIANYEGYRYSPALAQFYLREKESNKLGSIQQVDLFLNLEIERRATIFVKFENLLSEGFSEESYRIENYPIPGRSLKIGLSWRMLN